MTDSHARAVRDDEELARFVVRKRWIRADRSVKGDAFVTDRLNQLSCFRHGEFSMTQLWETGRTVAKMRGCHLYGRVDVVAKQFTTHGLEFDPNDEPPNHVNVVGWPVDADEQFELAESIAAKGTYHEHSL